MTSPSGRSMNCAGSVSGVGEHRARRRADRRVLFWNRAPVSEPGKVIYDRAHSAIAEASRAISTGTRSSPERRWFHWSGITPALSRAAAETTAEACAAARRRGAEGQLRSQLPRQALDQPEQAGEVLAPLMPARRSVRHAASRRRAPSSASNVSETRDAKCRRRSPRANDLASRPWPSPSARARLAARPVGARCSSPTGATHFSRRHEIAVSRSRRRGRQLHRRAHLFPAARRCPAARRRIRRRREHAEAHHPRRLRAVLTLGEVEALAAGAGGGRVQR